MQRLRAALAEGVAVAALGFHATDPTGYGRLIVKDGALVAIVEEKDASPDERKITFCNGGVMALAGKTALAILDKIDDNNAKKEFYLTDAVAIARAMGLKTVALETTEDDVRGVNTQAQLAEAEAILQDRLRKAAMDAGVNMVAPHTVQLGADTKFGRDVVIEPYVVFGPGVTVEDGALIRSFSHLEKAHVGRGASVGPYARLRPGANLGEKVRVGNFVEVKESTIGDRTAVNHLTYIGDSTVGEGANIGAGTITCNYDGTQKHRTDIGDGAFVGSNSSLVAPVKIARRLVCGLRISDHPRRAGRLACHRPHAPDGQGRLGEPAARTQGRRETEGLKGGGVRFRTFLIKQIRYPLSKQTLIGAGATFAIGPDVGNSSSFTQRFALRWNTS